MLISTVLRFFNAVLLLVVLARFWGPETFGIFMYPFTLAGIIVILVDYGFNLQLVRDVGKNSQDVHRLICQAINIKTFLTAIVILAGLPFIIFLKAIEGYRLLLVLLLFSNILNSYGLVFNLSFRGLGLFDKEVIVTFWLTIITFIIIGSLILFGEGPEIIAWALVITRAFFMGHSWVVYRQVVGKDKFIFAHLRPILTALKKGAPFAAHVALGTLYFSVDTVIIQHLLGPQSVGIYQAGLRVMLGGLIFADVLGNVYLSGIARESVNRGTLVHVATRMTRHFLMVASLGFVCMIAFPDLVVKLIYGSSGYSKVIPLLPLFGVVLLLRFMGASYGIVLTVDDKQGVRTMGAGLSVIVSVALNLILIPVFALRGALFASIITHIFLVGVYIIFTQRQVRSLLIDLRTWFLIIIAAAAGFFQMLMFPARNIMTYTVMATAFLCTGIAGVTTSEYGDLVKRLRRVCFEN